MHLISLPASPFAARVRIAIYAKELDVDVVPPPAVWPSNPQFRHVNPIGRIPVLVLEDGDVVPESAVILEFLEEHFAQARPLLPSDIHGRARARLLVRVSDLYLMPPMVSLAKQRDERDAIRLIEELVEGLSSLGRLLDGGAYAVGGQLTLADCALGPVLFAAKVTGERIGIDLIEAAPGVACYADLLRQDEHVARVIAEMEEGLRQLARGS